jgi:hypothetical protein
MCCPETLARHIMHAWLIPPGEELRAVIKIVADALKAAISSLAD